MSSAGRGRGSSSSRSRGSSRQSGPRSSSATASATATTSSLSRSTRRRSLDPYPRPPSPVNPTEDQGEGVPSEAGPSRVTGPAPPPGRLSPTTEETRAASNSPKPPSTPDKKYDLVVVQQPSIGAAVGMDRMTLGRLPIVPAPVVQLIVRDQEGEDVDLELPYLFCSCVLKQEDGTSPVEISAPEGSTTRDAASFSALLGNLVRNAHRVTDLEGNSVSQFVFEDVSVRLKGRYTLEFRLGEAIGSRPKSPRLAAVVSDPFDVVPWEEYPGRPAADVLTDISRNLHEQGVPIYVPPLVLSASAPPPPPSSNPFPDDANIPRIPPATASSSLSPPSPTQVPGPSPADTP